MENVWKFYFFIRLQSPIQQQQQQVSHQQSPISGSSQQTIQLQSPAQIQSTSNQQIQTNRIQLQAQSPQHIIRKVFPGKFIRN